MYGCLIINLNSDMVDVVLVLYKPPFKSINEFIQLQLNCVPNSRDWKILTKKE